MQCRWPEYKEYGHVPGKFELVNASFHYIHLPIQSCRLSDTRTIWCQCGNAYASHWTDSLDGKTYSWQNGKDHYLPFFYLLDYNLLIEYQGEQHKKVVDFFGGEEGFKIRQEHDNRKKKYAKEHNIQLLEIWYNEDIEQKLKETLNLETVETTGV